MLSKSLLILIFLAFEAIGVAATYHVDSQSGDDSRSGLAPEQAWKSLERINGQVFQTGDKILFKAGTRYAGQLKPQGSGKLVEGKPLPIVIGSYGAGPKPRIDGEGKFLDTVLLRNIEYWEIQDIEVTNQGPTREPWRTGIRITSDGFGKMRHIHLRNLHVHDVNGDLRKSHEGCGIFIETKGGGGSHFDDLLVENCHLERTDRNGICQRSSGGARSLRIVIRGNLLEDIGGDGIKPWGSNSAIVEHNIMRGGRTRCQDAAAGIWPWDCDDTVIQFNEVSGMKGTTDGQGFDSDYRCRNSVFQYNYSHDNEGGFMLICTPGNSYCENTIIRYNISQNDGINSARVFHFGGGAKNTSIYNNVIYIGPKQSLPLLSFTEWSGGNAQDTYFYNNIFYVEGQVTYRWGKSRNNVFDGNVFYGNHVGPPNDPNAIARKPPLANPGSGGKNDSIQFSSLTGYKLLDAAGFARGKIVLNNGGRDFFGNPVPADKPPCRGIFEYVQPMANIKKDKP
ncbi:MAG: right-handed parallel beta-helix repeat-containing protein [Candidatus Sumerlaeota bacterium]|nr:right-handed parallel beta-helix repeat-containing protein [Candidatus Sumerlaeota bacterium]